MSRVLLKLRPPAGSAGAYPSAPGYILPAAAVVTPSDAVPQRVGEWRRARS